jgi:hypothetical protein
LLRTGFAGPLFGDTAKWVKVYTVAPGSHWINVGKGWRDGATPDDCSELQTDIIAAWAGATATIALTVEIDPAVCAAAKAKSKAKSKDVARLKTKLKNASKAQKPGVKEALEKARGRLEKARAAVTTSC